MEFVGRAGESGGGMYVVSILLIWLNSNPWRELLMSTAVLTRLSDLHKVLANLARATLESIVQER